MNTTFTIGCDPEFFVADKNGKTFSVHDIVPGSKKKPHKVTGGAVQPDGLAAEFNIDPVPMADFERFNENILSVLKQTQSFLPAGSQVVKAASTVFDKAYYDSLPDEVKVLGCEPDFCAWSVDPFAPNPAPDGTSGLRSAAGHIHIGWGSDIPADHPDHINVCRSIIRQLDYYVGLGMTVMDTDCERRKLYGKAGAYRPKSYGVEYRTPSNAWIMNIGRRRFIHGLTKRAVDDMVAQRQAERFYGSTYGDVQSIINNGDAASARKFLTDVLGVRVPSTFEAAKKAA